MLRLHRAEHVLDRRSTHRRRRRVTQNAGEHPFDNYDPVGTLTPARSQCRCWQPSVGGFRGAGGERDRLVRFADLDRRRPASSALDEAGHPVGEFGLDVDTARRELDQHRVVDTNNVGLTIRVDVTELDTERRT